MKTENLPTNTSPATPISAKLLAACGVAICFAGIWFGTTITVFDCQFLTWFSLSVLLAGVFPVSAIAFRWLEVPGIVEQVQRDCYLLGTERVPQQRSDPSVSLWSHGSYAIHYTPALITTILGVGLFFGKHEQFINASTLQAMRFGFLGAYIYCVNLVYRRYTTLDLQPYVYMRCALGLLAGLMFNYVAFGAISGVVSSGVNQPLPPTSPGATATSAEFTGMGAAAAAILSFSLGYFPNLAISWFGRLSFTALREGQRRSDALPLAMIDGISELHETRLRDEGIDNIQNLATADIRDLVIQTPFCAQEIVEWIDQAVLYLYLEPSEIVGFRRAGARSVTDFGDLWAEFSIRYEVQAGGILVRRPAKDNEEFCARRKAIAQQLQTTEERLDSLYRAVEFGPNMHFVRTYWNNVGAIETRARAAIVSQVCGRVGSALRTSQRDGAAMNPEAVLKQVANALLSETSVPTTITLSPDAGAAALYGQAWLNGQLGKHSEAKRLYKVCIETFPDDPVAFNDLAWLLLEKTNDQPAYVEAEGHAINAVRLARMSEPPNSALAAYLDTLALAYIRLEQPEKADELIEEAILVWKTSGHQDEPKFLETRAKAAEVLYKLGNKDKAKELVLMVRGASYASTATDQRITLLLAKLAESDGSAS